MLGRLPRHRAAPEHRAWRRAKAMAAAQAGRPLPGAAAQAGPLRIGSRLFADAGRA
jgi:hypothetical protein